jgi:hypothetical protein
MPAMRNLPTGLLPRFFESTTRQTFADLRIDDPPALRYLTELLTRFVRAEALRTIRELPGRRLDTVADSLLAIQQAWDPDAPGFDPGAERALRRQIGDYTLFMTGIFRDYVDRLSVTGYYEHEGRHAYRFVAAMARAGAEADAPLYRRLADRFEMYAGALTYARKVYFRADAVPAGVWPADPFFRSLLVE